MTDGPRKIAIGFDGSPCSCEALRWGLVLANQCDADVLIVHGVGIIERVQEADALRDLREVALVLSSEIADSPERVRWHLSEGDPCSALLQTIDEPFCADLIVVGTRDHRLDQGLPLGSTSLEVVGHSSVPVVVVPGPRR
jgi:nucleotide-binding universal stress UspA family protein